jgi:hypothetical protein
MAANNREVCEIMYLKYRVPKNKSNAESVACLLKNIFGKIPA